MDIHVLLIVAVGAVLASLIAGLLGGGIGLILIPTLMYTFHAMHVPQAIIMHLAIGTTLSGILAMASVSMYSHHKKGNVGWPIVRKMLVPLAVAVVIGSYIASALPSHVLRLAFGVVVLFLVVFTWSLSDEGSKEGKPMPLWMCASFGAFVGLVGSIVGINPFCVPFFKSRGIDIHRAVGTTVTVGAIMALFICIMFIIVGWHMPGLPAYSLGFVNWALFIPLAIAGIIFAPLGAKVGHNMSRKWLKRLYCLLLLVVGIKMLIPF